MSQPQPRALSVSTPLLRGIFPLHINVRHYSLFITQGGFYSPSQLRRELDAVLEWKRRVRLTQQHVGGHEKQKAAFTINGRKASNFINISAIKGVLKPMISSGTSKAIGNLTSYSGSAISKKTANFEHKNSFRCLNQEHSGVLGVCNL